MKISMPQEIEVWYVFPAIRREFAKELLIKGFSQKQIASKMGLTQAAVSQYIKSKRATNLVFEKEVKNEIKKAVNRFVKTGNMVKEMLYLSGYIKKNMHICKIHKSFENIPKNCALCYK